MPRTPIFATAEAVEEAFYDAMQRADLPGLMALWADDDDVVCVHPGGQRITGLEAIRASWQEIFANGSVNVRPAEIRAYEGPLLSVHNVIEQVQVSGRMGEEVVQCVATNIYVKGAAGWRLLIHHSSPGGDAEPANLSAGSSTLH